MYTLESITKTATEPTRRRAKMQKCCQCGLPYAADGTDTDAYTDSEGEGCCGDCYRSALAVVGHLAPWPDMFSIEGLETAKEQAAERRDWDERNRLGARIAWLKFCERNHMDAKAMPEKYADCWIWAWNFKADERDLATLAEATGYAYGEGFQTPRGGQSA